MGLQRLEVLSIQSSIQSLLLLTGQEGIFQVGVSLLFNRERVTGSPHPSNVFYSDFCWYSFESF